MAKWTEPGDMLDVFGMQQPVHHVENEQCLHAVVGKTFPRFGEREIAETARMPQEAAILRIMHRRRECCVRPDLASAHLAAAIGPDWTFHGQRATPTTFKLYPLRSLCARQCKVVVII